MRLWILSSSLLMVSLAACGDDRQIEPRPAHATLVPLDGAIHVSILSPITVTLSDPLTCAITDLSYSLVWDRGVNEIMEQGIEVAGVLSGSGTQIRFTPDAPLVPGMTYRFALSDVVTGAGPLPTLSTRFRTWADPIDRTISYTAADTISQVAAYVYDAAYAQIGSMSFNNPGVDATWLTADDVQSAMSVYAEPREGHWTRHTNYNQAGADTDWGTADDVLNYHQLRTFDAEGQLSLYDSYASLGPDNQPFTGDETYSFRNHRLYGANGLLTRYFRPTAAGADGEWFTGDDVSSISYTVYEYDEADRLVRERYFGRGPDNLWFTADDLQTGYVAYGLLPDGRKATESECGDPGPDTLWLTADDVLAGVTTFEYNVMNLLVSETWRDDSNEIGYYAEFEHDAAGRRTVQRRYDRGADDVYQTADDFVSVEWQHLTP